MHSPSVDSGTDGTSSIILYEEKNAKLEKKVSDLENYSAGLRECLLKNVQFSTKLSTIAYGMDCLLVKKGKEIHNLEKQLEESAMRFSQLTTQDMLMDFDIKLETTNEASSVAESTKDEFNVNDYVTAMRHGPCQSRELK